MSVHVEWLNAAEAQVEVYEPGEEWVGAEDQSRTVLTLSNDDVVAVEGSIDSLLALAARIAAGLSAHIERQQHAREESLRAGQLRRQPNGEPAVTGSCYLCGARIHAQGPTWVDDSDGDVCSALGGNHPHVPESDGETRDVLAELVRE